MKFRMKMSLNGRQTRLAASGSHQRAQYVLAGLMHFPTSWNSVRLSACAISCVAKIVIYITKRTAA
ncbi:MAG: hypothetical protein E7271_03730 [Lachnospiraceae bacterium]|nr:hypothetical protein [Lachnospiraceae bacterium]